jgi:hypothetical protein
MRKATSLVIFLVQVFSCSAVLFVIYMLLAIVDNDEVDLISEVGLLVVQPIMGAIMIAITIALCLIVGLPIRLNARLREWWMGKPLIPIVGGVAGLICLLFAFRTNLMEQAEVVRDGEPKLKLIPNGTLLITGWFAIAFSLLHFYPQFIVQYIVRWFTRPKPVM